VSPAGVSPLDLRGGASIGSSMEEVGLVLSAELVIRVEQIFRRSLYGSTFLSFLISRSF